MVNTTISNYRIIEKLGGGGIGIVYKAYDTKLQRTVALKFLNNQFLFDDEEKQRFELEAQAASALQHNNICTIHEINETEDGQFYIVMDYYIGKNLREKLKGNKLTLKDFFNISIQLTEGLSKAHNNGIIHRDIKPANIFITNENVVKILDFGLAKFTNQPFITKKDTPHGTITYMAPESLKCEEIDYTTDIWSLGVILYEMLVGRKLYQNQNEQAIIYSILNEEIPNICTLRPDLDQELCNIIMDCLIKDKNERCQSIAEINRKLKILSLDYSSKKKSLDIEHTNKANIKENNKIKYLLLALLGLMIIAIFVQIYLLNSKPNQLNLANFKYTPIAVDKEPEGGASWSPDGKSIVYVKTLHGYNQIFIRNLESSIPIQITNFENRDAYRPFWSPNGKLIYFLMDGSLFSVGIAGGEPKKIIDSVGAATISPDSKIIAFWRPEPTKEDSSKFALNWNSPVFLYSLTDKKIRKYLPAPFANSNCYGDSHVKFSPDGKKIALSIYGNNCASSEIWILPWPENKNEVPFKVFESLKFLDAPRISWVNNSRNIMISSCSGLYDQKTFLGDIENDSYNCIIAPLEGDYFWGEISTKTNSIALTREQFDYDIISIPIDGSKPELLISSLRNDYSLTFSKDGKKYVYITDKNGSDEIWLRNVNGDERPIITKKDFPGENKVLLLNANISPDGNLVAFRIGRKNLGSLIYLVSSLGGNPTRLLDGDNFEDICSWSNDSKYLAVAINEFISIIKVGTQEPPKILENTHDYASWACWSPDNNWLSYFDKSNKIVLISPNGKIKKKLNCPIPEGNGYRLMVWQNDSSTLLLVSTHGGKLYLYKQNIESEKYSLINEYESNVIIVGFNWAAVFGILSPNGKNIIATTMNDQSDIWLLEGATDYLFE